MQEYNNLKKMVIVYKSNVLDDLEAKKIQAIKDIMRVVDISCEGYEHADIRKVVLDSINNMSRQYAVILEKILENIDE